MRWDPGIAVRAVTAATALLTACGDDGPGRDAAPDSAAADAIAIDGTAPPDSAGPDGAAMDSGAMEAAAVDAAPGDAATGDVLPTPPGCGGGGMECAEGEVCVTYFSGPPPGGSPPPRCAANPCDGGAVTCECAMSSLCVGFAFCSETDDGVFCANGG